MKTSQAVREVDFWVQRLALAIRTCNFEEIRACFVDLQAHHRRVFARIIRLAVRRTDPPRPLDSRLVVLAAGMVFDALGGKSFGRRTFDESTTWKCATGVLNRLLSQLHCRLGRPLEWDSIDSLRLEIEGLLDELE